MSQRIEPVVLPERPPASIAIFDDGSLNALNCALCLRSRRQGMRCGASLGRTKESPPPERR